MVHKSPGAKTEGVAAAAQLVVCALLPPAHPHGTLLRHSPVRCLIHTHAVCFLQGVLTHSDSPPCKIRHTYTGCVLQGGVCVIIDTPPCKIRHTYTGCFLQGVWTHSDSPGACGVTVHHLHLVLKANPVIDVLKQLLQATDRIQPSARCELD
jgi:hypothetical protein